MKRRFFVIPAIIMVSLLFFDCQADQSVDPESAAATVDPFSGISNRDMVTITGGSYLQTDGTYSFNHTISDFSMAKYEVTYELWYEVYQWAIANSYAFANAGREGLWGSTGLPPSDAKYEPVTTVNWRDAIVWCNAYSEMSGFTPCYTYSGEVIKSSQEFNLVACDNAVCSWSDNGYRLPTEGEWLFVASNKGATPYNYASGAAADYSNAAETQKVAWYSVNSGSVSKDVGTTTNSSALGFWDLSGNVEEWCWDRYGSYPENGQTDYRGVANGENVVRHGGSANVLAEDLRLGIRYQLDQSTSSYSLGFRVARAD